MKHKLIKKVLMCKPLYFDTFDYIINPWMKPGSIDKQKAFIQWENLVRTYKQQDIKVEVIEQKQDVPDMVWTTDQGIVHGRTVLLSRFWHDERKRESIYYEQWFRDQGYEITYLPKNVYLEGNGDSYIWNNKLLVGVGYRADKKTCDVLSKFLDIEVIPLQIIDPKFYHLDIGFFPLNNETAFYYPTAFSEESRGVLKKLVPNLIEFTKDEAHGFAANSVTTDHHVICQKGNITFEAKLHEQGYKTLPVDLGEFKKSGGGIHCLTNILEESFA